MRATNIVPLPEGLDEALYRLASMRKASTPRASRMHQLGSSGLHKLRPTKMEAAADTRLKGKRVQDGEKCSATFLSKEERDEAISKEDNLRDLYYHAYNPTPAARDGSDQRSLVVDLKRRL